MTLKTLMSVIDCPIELRTGSKEIFAKISPENISKHLGDEVFEIKSRWNTLIVRTRVPEYELDVAADDEFIKKFDLPWF